MEQGCDCVRTGPTSEGSKKCDQTPSKRFAFAGISPRRVDGQFERLCASADQLSLRFGTYRRADTDIAFLVRR